ncbi:MAG: AAA family ATPase [Ruminococcus sp.]|nr:AAA family ATPase [Ruminococcus sp.]
MFCHARSFIYGAGEAVNKQVIRNNAKEKSRMRAFAKSCYPHNVEVPMIEDIYKRRAEAFGEPDFSDIPSIIYLEYDKREEIERTQAVIAKRICLSTATVSQFLSDSYSGDNTEIAMKINSFIDLQEMRTAYTKAPQFTDKIRNTRKIINTLDYVYANRCTGIVSGVSGSGKTTALKSYQKIMSGVIYIQADTTKWSPCSILKLIAKSMNKECRSSSSDILDWIVDELAGTDRLIIIDEAQHLKARAFDTLRVLNDRAEVGVIYAETPDIIKRMTIGREKEEFDQVYSRIEYTCNLSNRFNINEIAALS